MNQESDLTNLGLPRRIHDAQQRAEQEELERKLIEGLESGNLTDITPEYWERKRRQLVKRHSKKKP